MGLSPEETTWESWSNIKQTFNLEDKVFLQGPRDDTNGGANGPSNTNNPIDVSRPIIRKSSRQTARLAGWNEFIH